MSPLWLLTSYYELLLECSFFPETLEWALKRGWWQPQQITFIRSKQWIIKTRNNLNKTWLYDQQPHKEICQTSLCFLTCDKKKCASYDHDKWHYLINHYLALFLCLPCFCWSAETDNSQRVRDNDSAQHLKLREKQRLFEEVYQHDVDNYLPSSHLQIDSRKRERQFCARRHSCIGNVTVLRQGTKCLSENKTVGGWSLKQIKNRSCERTCHEKMLINRSERSIHTLITWWSCDTHGDHVTYFDVLLPIHAQHPWGAFPPWRWTWTSWSRWIWWTCRTRRPSTSSSTRAPAQRRAHWCRRYQVQAAATALMFTIIVNKRSLNYRASLRILHTGCLIRIYLFIILKIFSRLKWENTKRFSLTIMFAKKYEHRRWTKKRTGNMQNDQQCLLPHRWRGWRWGGRGRWGCRGGLQRARAPQEADRGPPGRQAARLLDVVRLQRGQRGRRGHARDPVGRRGGACRHPAADLRSSCQGRRDGGGRGGRAAMPRDSLVMTWLLARSRCLFWVSLCFPLSVSAVRSILYGGKNETNKKPRKPSMA